MKIIAFCLAASCGAVPTATTPDGHNIYIGKEVNASWIHLEDIDWEINNTVALLQDYYQTDKVFKDKLSIFLEGHLLKCDNETCSGLYHYHGDIEIFLLSPCISTSALAHEVIHAYLDLVLDKATDDDHKDINLWGTKGIEAKARALGRLMICPKYRKELNELHQVP